MKASLSPYFSDYEINKHMKTLKDFKLISVDEHGRHFFRGKKTLYWRVREDDLTNTICHVHDENVLTREAWKGFVCAVIVTTAAHAMKNISRRQQAQPKEKSTSVSRNSPSKGAAVGSYLSGQAVSLALISTVVPILFDGKKPHKSTASRILRDAVKAGLVKKKERLKKIRGVKPMNWMQFMQYRASLRYEHSIETIQKIRLVGDRACIQMPNIVWTNKVKFTSRPIPSA